MGNLRSIATELNALAFKLLDARVESVETVRRRLLAMAAQYGGGGMSEHERTTAAAPASTSSAAAGYSVMPEPSAETAIAAHGLPRLSATFGEAEQEVTHGAGVCSVAWRPDGLKLASACDDRKVRLIDAASGRVEREVTHGDCVNSVAWKPDGLKLASACDDGKVRIIATA